MRQRRIADIADSSRNADGGAGRRDADGCGFVEVVDLAAEEVCRLLVPEPGKTD